MMKGIRHNRMNWEFRAFRKPNAMTYHQWRINGKRVTYGEYMKERMTCIYYEPLVQKYVTFTKKGNIVEVEKF